MKLPDKCKQCIYFEFIDCSYCSVNPNHEEPGLVEIKDRFEYKIREIITDAEIWLYHKWYC